MSADVIETMARVLDRHQVAARKGPLRRALSGVGCACGWEDDAEIEFHSHVARELLSVVRNELADEALRLEVAAVFMPLITGQRSIGDLTDAALTAVAARFGGAP